MEAEPGEFLVLVAEHWSSFLFPAYGQELGSEGICCGAGRGDRKWRRTRWRLQNWAARSGEVLVTFENLHAGT